MNLKKINRFTKKNKRVLLIGLVLGILFLMSPQLLQAGFGESGIAVSAQTTAEPNEFVEIVWYLADGTYWEDSYYSYSITVSNGEEVQSSFTQPVPFVDTSITTHITETIRIDGDAGDTVSVVLTVYDMYDNEVASGANILVEASDTTTPDVTNTETSSVDYIPSGMELIYAAVLGGGFIFVLVIVSNVWRKK
jgi:hypothetical protein